MRELSLHLLDIAENGVSAGAQNITITIVEDLRTDRLQLAVEDDGRGMDAAMVEQVTNPFITTRTTRKVGLGIPLLKLAAEMCDGEPDRGIHPERRHDGQCGLSTQPHRSDAAGRSSSARCWRCWWAGRRCTGCCAIASTMKSSCSTTRRSKKNWAILPLSDPEVIGFLRGALREGIADVTRRTRGDYVKVAEG